MTRADVPAWPGWKQASHYPKTMTANEWRWQFLRRNPAYHRVWEAPVEPESVYYVVTDARGSTTQDPERAAALAAAAAGAAVLRALYIPEASAFGVRCILDPALPAIPRAIERSFWTTADRLDASAYGALFNRPHAPNAETWAQWQDARKEGLVVHVFDLRGDIDEQLEGAIGWLRTMQRRRRPTRARTEKWASYLRVLDARACGASWRNVALHLGISVDTARNYHRAAERLCAPR